MEFWFCIIVRLGEGTIRNRDLNFSVLKVEIWNANPPFLVPRRRKPTQEAGSSHRREPRRSAGHCPAPSTVCRVNGLNSQSHRVSLWFALILLMLLIPLGQIHVLGFLGQHQDFGGLWKACLSDKSTGPGLCSSSPQCLPQVGRFSFLWGRCFFSGLDESSYFPKQPGTACFYCCSS